MSYSAISAKLTDVRLHPNADRLKLATVEGKQVIVGIDSEEGDTGLYFPVGGVLLSNFCKEHDLYRRKDEKGNPAGGMFDKPARVRAIRLRGEVSEGFFMPDTETYSVGPFSDLGLNINKNSEGELICEKYVPRVLGNSIITQNSIQGFLENYDEHRAARKLHEIAFGLMNKKRVVLTEQLHGSSGRVACLPRKRDLRWYEKLLKWAGVNIDSESWEKFLGTRRTLLDNKCHLTVEDHRKIPDVIHLMDGLRRGETVYYELVGYTETGQAIMPSVFIDRLSKEARDKYGKVVTFNYGNHSGQSSLHIYRITQTLPGGETLELSWDQLEKRANELGALTVPKLGVLTEDNIDSSPGKEDFYDKLVERLDEYSSGDSVFSTNHFKVGVCVRVDSAEPTVYRHKSVEVQTMEEPSKDIEEEEESVTPSIPVPAFVATETAEEEVEPNSTLVKSAEELDSELSEEIQKVEDLIEDEDGLESTDNSRPEPVSGEVEEEQEKQEESPSDEEFSQASYEELQRLSSHMGGMQMDSISESESPSEGSSDTNVDF